MSTAENAAGIRKAIDLARPHLPRGAYFDPGWDRRSRSGVLRPRGIVNHTTEDPRPIPWASLLPILRNGHGSISGGPICNFAINRDEQVVVIAAGVAWHAGAGGWNGLTGNPSVFGTEYQRGQGQVLTTGMLRAGLVLDWALTQVFPIPIPSVCEHHEWAPGRKSDRKHNNTRRVSGPDWRRQLREITANPPGQRDVIRPGDRGADVLDWKRQLDRLYPNHRYSGNPTDLFDDGTTERTLLMLDSVGLTPTNRKSPRVGPLTRRRMAQLLTEPWAGKLVQARSDVRGVRFYMEPGWHPQNPTAGTLRGGHRFQGGTIQKFKVGNGFQYQVFTRGSTLIRFVTAHPKFVELVDP
jgi:hypothetical protein